MSDENDIPHFLFVKEMIYFRIVFLNRKKKRFFFAGGGRSFMFFLSYVRNHLILYIIKKFIKTGVFKNCIVFFYDNATYIGNFFLHAIFFFEIILNDNSCFKMF